MEAAVEELTHSADQHAGGVLIAFFELLWAAKPAAAARRAQYAEHMPAIPDTVVLNCSRVQRWFFTPQAGGIKRKGPRHLNGRSILAAFCGEPFANEKIPVRGDPLPAPPAAPAALPPVDDDPEATPDTPPRPHPYRPPPQQITGLMPLSHRVAAAETDVVAQFACRASSAASLALVGAAPKEGAGPAPARQLQVPPPRTRYFTADGLHRMLCYESLGEPVLLQRFVVPKSPDPCLPRNETITAQWQWSSCVCVRHCNTHLLADRALGPAARCETFESGQHSFSTMTGTNVVGNRIRLVCNAIAEHVFAVAGLHVRRLAAVFKVSAAGGGIQLLFVQSAHVSTGDALYRAPALERPATALARPPSPSAPGAPGRATPLQKPKARSPTRRFAMGTARARVAAIIATRVAADPESVVRERAADERFLRMAPKAWSRHEDEVRRAARKRRGTLAQYEIRRQAVADIATVAPARSPARSSDGSDGGDGDDGADDDEAPAEHEPAVSFQDTAPYVSPHDVTEVFDDTVWGRQDPVDKALLRPPYSAGLFARDDFAAGAGALGYGAEYVACMRPAAVSAASVKLTPEQLGRRFWRK